MPKHKDACADKYVQMDAVLRMHSVCMYVCMYVGVCVCVCV